MRSNVIRCAAMCLLVIAQFSTNALGKDDEQSRNRLYCFFGATDYCGPEHYANKSYKLASHDTLSWFGSTSYVRLGECKMRTRDNEGCLVDARISGSIYEQSCSGNWWVKKMYGKQQIYVAWFAREASAHEHCRKLPETSIFTASEFKK